MFTSTNSFRKESVWPICFSAFFPSPELFSSGLVCLEALPWSPPLILQNHFPYMRKMSVKYLNFRKKLNNFLGWIRHILLLNLECICEKQPFPFSLRLPGRLCFLFFGGFPLYVCAVVMNHCESLQIIVFLYDSSLYNLIRSMRRAIGEFNYLIHCWV